MALDIWPYSHMALENINLKETLFYLYCLLTNLINKRNNLLTLVCESHTMRVIVCTARGYDNEPMAIIIYTNMVTYITRV